MIRVQDHTNSFSFAACEVAADELLEIFDKIKKGAEPRLWCLQMK
jgi:hypothetical protein